MVSYHLDSKLQKKNYVIIYFHNDFLKKLHEFHMLTIIEVLKLNIILSNKSTLPTKAF